jgi:hypothetical protein
LHNIYDKAKVRQLTPQVLSKAKVMCYEDLEEARAKRAEKDETAADKPKRARKRQIPEAEAGMQGTKTTVICVIEVLTLIPEPLQEPKPESTS